MSYLPPAISHMNASGNEPPSLTVSEKLKLAYWLLNAYCEKRIKILCVFIPFSLGIGGLILTNLHNAPLLIYLIAGEICLFVATILTSMFFTAKIKATRRFLREPESWGQDLLEYIDAHGRRFALDFHDRLVVSMGAVVHVGLWSYVGFSLYLMYLGVDVAALADSQIYR